MSDSLPTILNTHHIKFEGKLFFKKETDGVGLWMIISLLLLLSLFYLTCEYFFEQETSSHWYNENGKCSRIQPPKE